MVYRARHDNSNFLRNQLKMEEDLHGSAYVYDKVEVKHPTSFTINLEPYYRLHYCALCKTPARQTTFYVEQDLIYSVDISKSSKRFRNYQQYLESATKRFKEMSIPLCLECWENQATCCSQCWLPIILVDGGYLGFEVLPYTTQVFQDRSGRKNMCLRCGFMKEDKWVLNGKDGNVLMVGKGCYKSRPCRHRIMLNGKVSYGTWGTNKIKKWCKDNDVQVPMHFMK